MVPLNDQERDAICRLLKKVQVAHHIPGRIRLKLNGQLSSSATEPPPDIQSRLSALPAVTDVRINALARSATITYKADEQIVGCLEALRDGDVNPLINFLESRSIDA